MTTAPRWLDDDELRTWLALFSVLVRLPGALDAQLQRDAGINLFEYQVLAALSVAPRRRLRMSVLAAISEGSLPRLSQAVKRLEHRGWVKRSPDPDDGRYTLAVLTDAGMATVADRAPGHVAEVRRLVFDPLADGQSQQLQDICGRIMRTVDSGGPYPGARPY
ncbi:MarR family transcriptional regulator [Nakamurella sp. YIM 132084]|uniref:MarR family transcriptional regulator n=1 Tax=Nakamurella leprariae TaxID=2803911 RepID=A0A938YBR4_9ACTN|nr:MarR family transcriptional regulator [Nakamurella leprariae]MBM9466723.1 MarR family transcriptional regulator [Nakamurella leprariae]